MIPRPILQTELNLFIDELRLAGYNIGLEQFIQVQTWLEIQETIPEELNKLKVFLRPLLCHSRKEQEEFDLYFESWVEQVTQKHARLAQAIDENQPISDDSFLPPNESVSKCRQFNWKGFVIFFTVLTLLILELFIFNKNLNPPCLSNEICQQEKTGLPPETIKPPNLENPKTKVQRSGAKKPQPQSSETQKTEVPQKILKVTVIKTKKMTLMDWLILSAALFLVPLLILFIRLWIWGWNRRQLGHAKRFLTRVSGTKGFRLQLDIKGVAEKLFQPIYLTGSSVQPSNLTAQHLDVEASIEQTLQAGGHPSPVVRSNKRSHYLLLIERVHFADHQADWFEQSVARVVSNDEIEWSQYYFNVDPRHCYSDRHELTALQLSELGDQYARSHLLIFSSSEKLMDPVTRKTVSWLDELALWSNRALLTLEPLEEIAGRDAIESGGFVILPANEDSIIALAEGLEPELVENQRKGAAFPHLLKEWPQQWMESHAPAEEAWAQLQPQLQRFLGEKGYYWLSACAVYPQLQWSLTLYLGERLNLADEKLFSQTLITKLVQLPWFRQGYMPNWLREILIADLSPAQEQAIRLLLSRLLEKTSRLESPVETDWTTELEQETLIEDALCVTSMADKLSVELPDKLRNTLNLSPEAAKKPFSSPKLYLMGGLVTVLLVTIALFFIQPLPKREERDALFYRLVGHTDGVTSVAFSPDANILASNSASRIILWDLKTKKQIGDPLKTENINIATKTMPSRVSSSRKTRRSKSKKTLLRKSMDIAFSPDGKTIASAGDDGSVILWNVKTRKPSEPLRGHSGHLRTVAFSPDMKTLASGGVDQTVILWNLATRKPLGKPLTG